MVITLIVLIIFAGCFASMFNNGLWSNTLMLVNVLTAGLLAFNYFEPLAEWLEQQQPSLNYIWDFVSVWMIFIVAMVALRSATDYVSNVKVRFFMPVDRAGSYIMAVWVSWVIVSFTTATLHTAPLARNFLGFQPAPEDRMLSGFAPDRRWLAWVRRESMGSLCRLSDLNPFDPLADFILRYGNRREEFEGQLTLMTPKGAAAAGATQGINIP